MPVVLVGSTVGGSSLVIVQLDTEGQVAVVEQLDPPEQQIGDVTSGIDGIYVTTCCEPAAGERFVLSPDRSKYTQLGNGTIQDVRDGVVLTVHQSAGFLEIQPDEGEVRRITAGSGHWFALDATFTPDGDIVVVATGDVDESAVFVIDPNSEHFDAGRAVLLGDGLGGRLGRPAVDAAGRVWLLVYRSQTDHPLRRIVLDPATGEVTGVHGAVPVDHAFDVTGTFVVSAYPDGTTRWRRYNNPAEVELDLPTLDLIDW